MLANDSSLVLDGQALTIDDLIGVAQAARPVRLDETARVRVADCHAWVEQVVQRGTPLVYGLNTGFGIFANVHVSGADSQTLSRNLILSHAVGTGEPLPEDVVRAAMLVRANTLAAGYSGVRPETLDTLIAMLNAGVHPLIPEKGSLGASGDLAPLSHLALVLCRDPHDDERDSGEAIYRGERMSGAQAMRAAGLSRVVISAKEGLALNNGTAFSAAMTALAWHAAARLVRTAEIGLAMSLEATRGVSAAYDARLHHARHHAGQIASAAAIRRLIAGSTLVDQGGRVQDAYSLRCGPPVMGAVRDVLAFVQKTLQDEINAASDNPLIFLELPGENKALSGGNFHGEPIAFGADFLGIAVSELGSLSERRIFRLTTAELSDGLPAMLIDEGGLNSGFMLAQYVAAALVADNKVLAHPDSVDSIPTSADQEDHISNSMNAARHTWEIVHNVEHIIGIELACAAQGLDLRLRHCPTARLGVGTRAAYRRLRQDIPPLEHDRLLYVDLDKACQLVREGAVLQAVEETLVAA
ncbi:MAG: histidine ammonia-lyase [Thermoflexales bacterium]|nr:histidine ammonia-lyase [Thermoflexales bacterium]